MGSLAIPSRRRFLLGAVALAAAPAIVRVASLMPISVPKLVVPAGGFTAGEIRAIGYSMLTLYLEGTDQYGRPVKEKLRAAPDGTFASTAHQLMRITGIMTVVG